MSHYDLGHLYPSINLRADFRRAYRDARRDGDTERRNELANAIARDRP